MEDYQSQNPLVSIIIPTHNRADLICRTIESVLHQTYKYIELIIVDDNSTDNTKEIVAQYKDERIKYIKHDLNRGAPAARNTGIKASKGQFIGLLDDDDEWLPDKLEKQLKCFDSSRDIGLVYAGYEIINAKGEASKRIVPTKRGYIFYDLLKLNVIGSPTNLIRRECFEKVGFCDESFISCQDWDLWIRISREYKIEYMEHILARYNLSDNRITTNNNWLDGYLLLIGKYKKDYLQHKDIYSNHLRSIGIIFGNKRDLQNCEKYLREAIMINKLNIRAIFHYILLKILNKRYYKLQTLHSFIHSPYSCIG
jgi:glycosyltransferase involved in cell wall biosynthesis